MGNRIAHLDGGSVKTYLEMIRVMDEGIGRVIQALNEIAASENTLVLFRATTAASGFPIAIRSPAKSMICLKKGRNELT